MARLPQVGGDRGNWGNILNDFLSQSHTPDGDLKPSAFPDASASDKGVIQLTGDLAGTAAAPTVPALADKYEKPADGIPEADLSDGVQTKLNTADTGTDADVAGYVNDENSETSAALSDSYVRHIGPSNGTDDTTAINTLLAAGGVVLGMAGETYKISARLVIPSDTTLDMTGCTIQAITGLNSHMLTNYAVQNPAYTNEDASMTAGSAVVSFSGAGVATNFTVGQTVVVDGAWGDDSPLIIVPLVGEVVSVNTGANTITLNKTAKCTTPMWAIKAYNRDANVKVVGGNWRRGSFGFSGTAINGNSLHFRHVDGLTVDIDEFYSTTNVAHYPISAADFTNGWFNVKKMTSGRDGIHLMGPFRNAHVESVQGTTSDDMLSVTGSDYAGGLTDSAGDCLGFSWGRVSGTSVAQQLVKILAGVNCHIDGVRGGIITGQSNKHTLWVGEDTGNLGTVGGTYGSLDLGIIDAAPASASYAPLFLASPEAKALTARLACPDFTGGMVVHGRGGTGGATGGAASTATCERLTVYFDNPGSGSWLSSTAAGLTIREFASDGHHGYGVPASIDPAIVRATDFTALGTNETEYFRVRDGGTISKIGIGVGVAAGNISVAVYRNKGVGTAAQPGTRLATSGSVACPTAGYAEVSLGATINVRPGDWIALSSSSNTATFLCNLGGVSSTMNGLLLGRHLAETSMHPCPTTPGTLTGKAGATHVLVGLP